jgi:hypothetical protein
MTGFHCSRQAFESPARSFRRACLRRLHLGHIAKGRFAITGAIDRFASAHKFQAHAQRKKPCRANIQFATIPAARQHARRSVVRSNGDTCERIAAVETRCVRCNAPMTCNPEGECWCAQFPPGPLPADAKACFCPDCLRRELQSSNAKAPDSPASGSFE